MVQRRLNKKRLALAIASLIGFIIIIVLIISFISNIIKKNSIEYKLEMVGYSAEEVEYIKSNFNKEEQKQLLTTEYNSILIPLYKEKYFRKDKLNDYLKYYSENNNLSSSEIVRKINTHTNIDF